MNKSVFGMAFFKDKDGKWTVIQFPNPLLVTWLFLMLLQMFMSASHLKSSIHQFSSAVLFAWAYMEVIRGDSSFRRLLGGIVLLVVLAGFFM